MPVPTELAALKQAAQLCGTFLLEVPHPHHHKKGSPSELNREFHVYLEIAMQAKHDPLIAGYCERVRVQPRRKSGTQIDHARTDTADSVLAPAGFYARKARTAAEVARDQMASRGERPRPGERVDAAVQKDVQHDGYRYELSYWDQDHRVYVLFHCYPES